MVATLSAERTPHSGPFDEVREIARVLEAMWPDDHRSAAYVKALDDKLRGIEEQLEAMRELLERVRAEWDEGSMGTELLAEISTVLNPASEEVGALDVASSEGSSPASSPTDFAGETERLEQIRRDSEARGERWVFDPARSPNVTSLPVCPECAAGRHVYCLDDGSSTWTDKCRCTCRDEQSPATSLERGNQGDPAISGTNPLRSEDSSPAKEPA